MTETQSEIRVLLVDDEMEFLESTAKALRRRGLIVTTASSGAEALQVSATETIDVGVLDVKMPGMDGHALFYALLSKFPSMRIIMLTGHGSLQKAFELGKNGLFTYLAKPVETDELVEAIRKASKFVNSEEPFEFLEEAEIEDLLPIRVLLVDDEPEFLSSTSKNLTRREMKVYTATNGYEALRILSKEGVDVAVLDVKMPGMGGLELFDRIKEFNPLIEIVLLTGHGNISLAVTGMKKGAFDYLTKPQETDEFVHTIQMACKKKRIAERMCRDEKINNLLEKSPD